MTGTIGRYEIVREIGQGGMGALFLAWDPLLERQIAIKVLRDAGSVELRARFEREARSAARLRHPNIVTVFDVGEHAGEPFMAMEFISGPTLSQIIRTGVPLSIVRKLVLIEELCAALAYAHRAGVIHRDIKPANLILEADGVLKVLDFGIARVMESGLTQSGLLIGTLNYMSPEQMGGRAIDGRSDMFAAGAVFYELLTRRQAFPGRLDDGVLNRILHEHPESLEKAIPGLEPEIAQIVNRALQKEADARYTDMNAMRMEIQRVRQYLESTDSEAGSHNPQDTLMVSDTELTPLIAPRRSTVREDVERRRQSQIEENLATARRALEAYDFERALASAEKALIIDPNEARVLALIDQARAALDQRHASQHLDEAQERLRRGALGSASKLVEQALALVPDFPAALTLRRTIEEAQREQERLRQRAEAVKEALDRARESYKAKALDDALKACEEALALDPERSDSRNLLDTIQRAIADRDQRRLEARVRATREVAKQLFQAGHQAEALKLLREFEPPHDMVAKLLEELSGEAARLERQHQIEESARAAIDDAKQAFAEGRMTDALRMLATFQPPNELVNAAHTELAAEEQRIRQEQELAARARAAVAEAKRLFDPDRPEPAFTVLRAFQPPHPSVAAALEDLSQEVKRVAKERGERANAAVREAQQLAAAGHHAAAVAQLEAFKPADDAVTDALRTLRRELREIEQQRAREREEAEQRAREARRSAVRAEAESALASGEPERALELLRGLRAEVPEDRRLDDLARAAEAAAAEARRIREQASRIAEHLAAAKRLKDGHDLNAALARVRSALSLDPAHAEALNIAAEIDQLLRMEEERRRAEQQQAREHEEAARQAREARLTAALDEAEKAIGAGDHERALGVLRQSDTPDDPRLTRLIQAAESAMGEARRARDRAERIAEHLSAAAGLKDHQDLKSALNRVKAALAIDGAHVEALARAAEIEELLRAAEQHRQEELRRAREREEAVRDVLKRAAATPLHRDAIALLQPVIDSHASEGSVDGRLSRALAERQNALDKEIGEERRAKDIATADASILALIQAEQFDAAESTLVEAEGRLHAKKELRAARTLLKTQRSEVSKRDRDAQRAAREREEAERKAKQDAALTTATLELPPRDLQKVKPASLSNVEASRVDTAPPRVPGLFQRRPVQLAAGGAVLGALLIAYALTGRQNPPVAEPVTEPQAVNEQPAPPATEAQPASDRPSPLPAPTLPAPEAPDGRDRQLATFRQRAQQSLSRGAPQDALAAVTSGLAIDAADPELRRLLDAVANDATRRVERARDVARQAGATPASAASFDRAARKEDEARQSSSAGRREDGVRALWAAADLYVAAQREARASTGKADSTAANIPGPVPSAAMNLPQPSAADQITRPPAPQPSPAPLPVPAPSPSPQPEPQPQPPPQVAPAPQPSGPPPSATTASDEDAIRTLLRAYEEAYRSLDANAVRGLYPGVNFSVLRQAFSDLRRQEIAILNPQITITGTTARVVCRVRQAVTTRVGNSAENVVNADFRLAKNGRDWVIVERR